MTHDQAVTLGVSLGVGIPVLVGLILFLVFRAVSKAMARARAHLENEGVILDSGPIWVTARYRNFSTQGMRANVLLTKNKGYVVLTKERLVMLNLSRYYGRFKRADLSRFTVRTGDDGALHIHSDDPPDASGSIDYRFNVPNTTDWTKTLLDAGMRG